MSNESKPPNRKVANDNHPLEYLNDNHSSIDFQVKGFPYDNGNLIAFEDKIKKWRNVNYSNSFELSDNYSWENLKLPKEKYTLTVFKSTEDTSAINFLHDIVRPDVSKYKSMPLVLMFRCLDDWFANGITNSDNLLSSDSNSSNIFWVNIDGKECFFEVSFSGTKINIWKLPDAKITPSHKFFCSVQ
jgi:hypothetical protein